MTWYEIIFSFFVAPGAFVAGLLYLAKLFYGHLLDCAKAGFEQGLRQKWEVRSAIQTALVNVLDILTFCLRWAKGSQCHVNRE